MLTFFYYFIVFKYVSIGIRISNEQHLCNVH